MKDFFCSQSKGIHPTLPLHSKVVITGGICSLRQKAAQTHEHPRTEIISVKVPRYFLDHHYILNPDPQALALFPENSSGMKKEKQMSVLLSNQVPIKLKR
jgi:hypothetical protein